MDAFKEEIEIGSSVESFLGLLNSQKELFHSQIDQLEEVVMTQCKLTGVNPLAQEMAAGALSIKIGKRPRDLLNPKAVKYMQAVFAIKDAISKKESREISALFGITVTQVRDFFVSQRMRVRKQFRLSREKADRSDICDEQHDRVPGNCNAIVAIDSDPLKSTPASALPVAADPVPLNSIIPTNVEVLATVSQNDIPPGISDSDRHFAENIFPMMRKEETFSGQVKLMDWILKIQDSSVLIWFLSEGGVMILTTWLSQAAFEEQTSVLVLILKVLCHLPLHKASPENMSAILQSVNGLRFYRTADVSNRARVLLSRWTKLFAKIQAMKKQNGVNSNVDAQSQMLLKQSIVEIMGDDSNPEELLSAANESSEHHRKFESSQAPKLLLASADDSAKKHMLGPSSSYNRERRKVQLVEQPGQKPTGRNPQTSRTMTANQSRPMSADDIQKAKMRALYMQSKYGKKDPSSSASGESKTIVLDKLLPLQPDRDSPISRNGEAKTGGLNEPSVVQSIDTSVTNLPLKLEEPKKPSIISQKSPSQVESVVDLKLKMNPHTILKNCKRIQIAWRVPPEIKLEDLWRVAVGGSSKEVGVQLNRNRREKATVYQSLQEIPLNPKEPWDREMDFDDSLTPEIPSEQPPEESVMEAQDSLNERQNAAVSATTSSSQSGALEPDLELLAALLKNPELVFALTSGKPGNLSGQDMIKLLDMIKSGGPSIQGNSMEPSRKVEEKVEVSLPSPTPSANPGTSGWTAATRNPFSRQKLVGARAPAASIQWQAAEPSAHSSPAVLPRTANVVADIHRHHSPLMERQPIPLQMPVRLPAKYHPNPHLQQPVQSNSQIYTLPYPNREPTGNLGTISDSWRSQQSQNTYYSGQGNNIATFQACPGGQYLNNTGFESWSPENSPRSRNHADSRGHREPEWSRQQNSGGYWHRDRKWRR